MRRCTTALLFALAALPAVAATPNPSTPAFRAGERYANVFSRTIAFHADGFEDSVRRVSGDAEYHVLDASASRPRLRIDYRYDGRPQGGGIVELRDGGATTCFDGKCAPNTDASGLAWNPRLWGSAPAALRVGQHWQVDIREPWELGTPGRETVSVVAVDAASGQVTLEREGEGEGAYLGDQPTLTLVRDGHSYVVRVLPGRSHWAGYTTFRAGIVLSDELMVERPVTLVSDQLGRIPARERQYILLNASP